MPPRIQVYSALNRQQPDYLKNICQCVAFALAIYAIVATSCIYYLLRGDTTLCGTRMTAEKLAEVGHCLPGWIPATKFSKCYKPIFGKVTYKEAEAKCDALNAKMLTINSVEEEYTVLNLEVDGTKLYRRFEYLILGPRFQELPEKSAPRRAGYRRLAHWRNNWATETLAPRELVSPSGQRSLYHNFHADEPNNAGGQEYCTEIRYPR
ncbi:unnamed protein product, partial [Mesorhabditis spiculigera]